jgi:hypothetical protein
MLAQFRRLRLIALNEPSAEQETGPRSTSPCDSE